MNRKEISRAIRNISRNTDEKKCIYCDKKKTVQNHHIIKVEDLTHIAWKNGMTTSEELRTLYIPTCNMCERDHIKFHSLMEDNYLEPAITFEDVVRTLDILAMIDLTNVSDELYDDYFELVDDMTNTMIYNLLQYGNFTEDELAEIENIIKEFRKDISIDNDEMSFFYGKEEDDGKIL